MSNQCQFVCTFIFPDWDVNGAEANLLSTPRHSQPIRCGYKGVRGWNELNYRGTTLGHWIGRNNQSRWFCSYNCLSDFYAKAGYDLSKNQFFKKHKTEEI